MGAGDKDIFCQFWRPWPAGCGDGHLQLWGPFPCTPGITQRSEGLPAVGGGGGRCYTPGLGLGHCATWGVRGRT